jgi:Trehalose-6-phosphatase
MNEAVTENPQRDEPPDAVPVPGALLPHLDQCALLLDIDGTLLDLAPTPREVWVPPDLAKTLPRLLTRSGGHWRWSADVRSTTSI